MNKETKLKQVEHRLQQARDHEKTFGHNYSHLIKRLETQRKALFSDLNKRTA